MSTILNPFSIDGCLNVPDILCAAGDVRKLSSSAVSFTLTGESFDLVCLFPANFLAFFLLAYCIFLFTPPIISVFFYNLLIIMYGILRNVNYRDPVF